MNTQDGNVLGILACWHRFDCSRVNISCKSKATLGQWHKTNAITIPIKMIAWRSSFNLRLWLDDKGFCLMKKICSYYIAKSGFPIKIWTQKGLLIKQSYLAMLLSDLKFLIENFNVKLHMSPFTGWWWWWIEEIENSTLSKKLLFVGNLD